MPDNVRLLPADFEISENRVIKDGEVLLRLTGVDDRPALDSVDQPLPMDCLHVIPGSPGYDLRAGLFMQRF
jgi:hypothetical protein